MADTSSHRSQADMAHGRPEHYTERLENLWNRTLVNVPAINSAMSDDEMWEILDASTYFTGGDLSNPITRRAAFDALKAQFRSEFDQIQQEAETQREDEGEPEPQEEPQNELSVEEQFRIDTQSVVGEQIERLLLFGTTREIDVREAFTLGKVPYKAKSGKAYFLSQRQRDYFARGKKRERV